jgi:hypothetical protein
MRKKLAVLAVGLAACVSAVPAQAVLDEGGGAAPTPASATEAGFDWTDAGIGAAVGAALAVALGVGVARRNHGQPRAVAGPAAR